MKRIRIDFAAPSMRRTLYRTPRLAWALMWVALPFGVMAGIGAWDYDRQLVAREAQLTLVRARDTAAQVARPVPSQPPLPTAQASAINLVIERLNLPWPTLRDAVQAATPPTVALLSVEPDAKKYMLRITAEARSSDDMIDYLQALKSEERFTSVTLASHEINDRDPNRPLRFLVEAQWRAP